MIKKVVLTSLILSLVSLSLFSQKLNNEMKGKLSYTQLPINPLPEDYTAYKVNAIGANNDLYRRDVIINKTNIVGFNKVDNSDYQFTIEIEEYPLQYTDSEKQTEVIKEKKDGVEKSYNFYHYTSTISYKYNLKVIDKDGNTIFGKEFSGNKDIVSKKSKSATEAYKSYSSKRKEIGKNILPDQAEKINDYINDQIGFPKKDYFVQGYLVKPKKYEYKEFDQAFEMFNQALELIKSDESKTAETMETLKPAIELWENVLKESDVENKKARINEKVTCAALYNIATSYMICKDYPKAIEYYQKCKSFRSNFANAHEMIKLAKNLQKRVEANI